MTQEKNEFIVTMLGEFKITYKEVTITDEKSRSRKPWNLLEYLITFREKELSQNKLIETFWPE